MESKIINVTRPVLPEELSEEDSEELESESLLERFSMRLGSSGALGCVLRCSRSSSLKQARYAQIRSHEKVEEGG